MLFVIDAIVCTTHMHRVVIVRARVVKSFKMNKLLNQIGENFFLITIYELFHFTTRLRRLMR